MVCGLLAAATLAVPTAWAGPLTRDVCEKLEVELADLAAAGAQADMAKGPAWARANLPPERIERIGRYIYVSEQLTFRCVKPKPDKAAAANPVKPAVQSAAVGAQASRAAPASGEAATKGASSARTPAQKAQQKPPQENAEPVCSRLSAGTTRACWHSGAAWCRRLPIGAGAALGA
jgi:hypothetical protein